MKKSIKNQQNVIILQSVDFKIPELPSRYNIINKILLSERRSFQQLLATISVENKKVLLTVDSMNSLSFIYPTLALLDELISQDKIEMLLSN